MADVLLQEEVLFREACSEMQSRTSRQHTGLQAATHCPCNSLDGDSMQQRRASAQNNLCAEDC